MNMVTQSTIYPINTQQYCTSIKTSTFSEKEELQIINRRLATFMDCVVKLENTNKQLIIQINQCRSNGGIALNIHRVSRLIYTNKHNYSQVNAASIVSQIDKIDISLLKQLAHWIVESYRLNILLIYYKSRYVFYFVH